MSFRLISVLLFALATSLAARAEVAELDEAKIATAYEFQKTPVWCWAASIHIALQYNGITLSQEKIVENTYGAAVPMAGNYLQISNNLNYVFSDNGKRYLLSASLLQVNNVPNTGSPWGITPEAIVNQLKKGRPIIVAYQSSKFSGHAVVLSGVTYKVNANNRIEIESFTVRDPFRYNQEHVLAGGKKIYANGKFPGVIQGVWLVDIHET